MNCKDLTAATELTFAAPVQQTGVDEPEIEQTQECKGQALHAPSDYPLCSDVLDCELVHENAGLA